LAHQKIKNKNKTWRKWSHFLCFLLWRGGSDPSSETVRRSKLYYRGDIKWFGGSA